MSVRVMALVWDRFPGSGSALLAMLALADYASDSGERIHPSVPTLAKKLRVSIRYTRMVLRSLEADGWIETVSETVGGPRTATRRYRIDTQKLKATPEPQFTPEPEFTPEPQFREGGTPVPLPLNPSSPDPSLTINEPLILSSSGDEVKISKEVYKTKRKRELSGWKLNAFYRFWDAFAYKAGKAEAADAWLDIPGLTAEMVDNEILPAATSEAQRRPQLRENGHTPKMAQGWLSGRRWEDELPNSKKSNGMPERTEEQWQAMARKLGIQEWIPPEPWLPWRSMVYAKEKHAVGGA